MGNPAVPYKLIAVRGTSIKTKTIPGAPQEGMMITWAKSVRADFVIRYFPSRNGWRVLDVRDAVQHSSHKRHLRWWTGQRRSKFYGTEDAAVMVAIHMGGQQPHPELAL